MEPDGWKCPALIVGGSLWKIRGAVNTKDWGEPGESPVKSMMPC